MERVVALGTRRGPRLAAWGVLCGCLLSATASRAGQTDVTFTINSATSQLALSGFVTGDFFGSGVSTIPLIGQISGMVNGALAKYTGSVTGRIDYDAMTLAANGIRLKGGNLDALPSGNWNPANWDPTGDNPVNPDPDMDGAFLGGTEAADYGLRVSTLVNAAQRNVVLDSRNLSPGFLPISGGSFTNGYGLEFKTGFNDLDALPLGTVDRQVLREELDTYELATPGLLQPNGQPYPGGIVWREVIGTDGFGNPVYDLTPAGLRNAFTSPQNDGIGADAVRIFNAQGQEIPQLFANNSVTNSTLSVTPTGGGNVNLALGMNVSATGSFFLGDFLVQLTFNGNINSTGTAKFIDPPPIVAASLNNARAVGFDNAGNGSVFADVLDGLLTPFDADFDTSNNVYVADVLRSRVTRFMPNGMGTVFADLADGVVSPSGVAVAPDGNVIVSNYLANTLVKVSPAGVGTPFADGTDGLNSPFGIAVDAAGNVYVANFNTRQVLKFDPAGNSSVFADASDGLFTPIDVTVDAAGNVYVADVLTSRVYKFNSAGVGSVFANLADGVVSPSGLALDAAGNLLVTNYITNTIVKVNPAGVGVPFADVADGISSPFGLGYNGTTPIFSLGAGGGGASVPEPSTWALALVGLAGLGLVARQRRS